MRLSVDGEMKDPIVWLLLRGEVGALLGTTRPEPGVALWFSRDDEVASIVANGGWKKRKKKKKKKGGDE